VVTAALLNRSLKLRFLAVAGGFAAILFAASPKPLWPGSKYTEADRDRAVERGVQVIYKIASNPDDFNDWGHDLLWCFYSISSTAKNPKIREMTRSYGHELALQWRRNNPEPPVDNAGDLGDYVFGSDAANRLGVPDGPEIHERIRQGVARYTAEDFLSFDPTKEPPPSDVPNECPKCQEQNPRGTLKCLKCNARLTFKSRYEVWLDALITAYTGDVYGVNLGASYDDVLRWIKQMRPYASREKVGAQEAEHITYAITHVIYTLNDYGKYRLNRSWLPQEFKFLIANLDEMVRINDPETLGEFMDTLRSLGMSEKDKLIQFGMEYQLSHQNADGSWGDGDPNDAYKRYHSTWTAVDGLREYAFQGERLRRPELMKLIKAR
jgi:hypothetical protein